jgi:hypothetical protein
MNIVDGKLSTTGGGVIMKAKELIFNKNRYFDFTSLIGTCYYPRPSEMTIEMADTTTIIIIDTLTSKMAPKTMSTIIDIPVKGDSLLIPSDGKKYWLVSYSPNDKPKMLIAGGPTYTLNCDCPSGACWTQIVVRGDATYQICQDFNCQACCIQTITRDAKTMVGGYTIVSGNTLIINGVSYR